MSALTVSKGVTTRTASAPASALDAVEAKLAPLGVEVRIDDASEDARAEGTDFVVGIGGAGRAAAQAYATATGRPWCAFETFEEVVPWVTQREGTSAFVFLPEAAFNVHAVPRMIEDGVRAALAMGFFPVPGDVSRAVAEAMRLVALALSPAPNAWDTIVYSGDAPAGEAHALFGDADIDAFRARAREGCAAIVIEGHGNGCDFRLGPNALCVQADELKPNLAKRGEAALPCQFGGPCLRRECNVVGIAELKTSLLVMLTCTGWLSSGGIIDPRFGLAAAALRGPWVRAVLTSIEITQTPWTFTTAAADFLAQGGSLGELTRLFNLQLPENARSFVCIGDPTSTIPTAACTDAFDPSPEAAAAAADVVDVAPVTSFRALVARELVALGFFTEEEASAVGFAELLAAYATKRSGFLAEIYGARSRPADGVSFEALAPTPLRHSCGAPLLQSHTDAHPNYAHGRTHWVCRRCGCIADTPRGMEPPALRLFEDRRLRLDGLPAGRPVTVVTAIESTGAVAGVIGEAIAMECASAGIDLVAPRGNVEAGLQMVCVSLAWDDEFATLRLPFVAQPEV